MSYVNYQPLDNNLLSTNNFKLVFDEFPKMEYFVQRFTFPRVNVEPSSHPSPFKSIPTPGNQISYESITFTFTISEDLSNYLEIYRWMIKTGTPNSHKEYQNVKDIKDCNLIITSNNKNPILTVKFKDVFPIALSGFELDVTNTEFTPVSATAEFVFNTLSFDTNF